MAVNNLKKLVEHELKDMYFAEQRLIPALAKLEHEALDEKIKEAFSVHKEQTKNQVIRLEKVFHLLGMKPAKKACAGILGLLKEKSDFAKERPSKEMRELFNLETAMKAERYEIGAYEGLIQLVGGLEHGEESRQLLQENLDEERAALQKLQSFPLFPQSII